MHQQAFELVKSSISKEMMLAYIDRDKESIIQEYASGRGRGAILLQDKKPLEYASKSLTPRNDMLISNEIYSWSYLVQTWKTLQKRKSDHKPFNLITPYKQPNLFPVIISNCFQISPSKEAYLEQHKTHENWPQR